MGFPMHYHKRQKDSVLNKPDKKRIEELEAIFEEALSKSKA